MALYGLSEPELDFFRSIDTPEKIQDYLDTLDYNFCRDAYVCKSPRMVMAEGSAHCLEGALFAAAAQRISGKPPLIMELRPEGTQGDDYHFISPFEKDGKWGAMAQSKTYTLKWRDPMHLSVRELVLSYFQGYVKGRRLVLRSYTMPVDASRFDGMEWISTSRSLEALGDEFDAFPHIELTGGVIPRDVPPELEGRLLKKP